MPVLSFRPDTEDRERKALWFWSTVQDMCKKYFKGYVQ
jgi:hypothetical protein